MDVLPIFLEGFYRSSGDANSDTVGGDIPGDDGAGADDDVVADGHAGQNDGVCADINVISDFDGCEDVDIGVLFAKYPHAAVMSDKKG